MPGWIRNKYRGSGEITKLYEIRLEMQHSGVKMEDLALKGKLILTHILMK
jgi:hypothetical protein